MVIPFQSIKRPGKMKVLLADDSGLFIDRMQDMLSVYRKLEITGCYSRGTEALKALRSSRPDLAILELRLPGLSALELIREARKEKLPTRFIVVSLFKSDPIRWSVHRAGAEYFFSKTTETYKISQAVSRMIYEEQMISLIEEIVA